MQPQPSPNQKASSIRATKPAKTPVKQHIHTTKPGEQENASNQQSTVSPGSVLRHQPTSLSRSSAPALSRLGVNQPLGQQTAVVQPRLTVNEPGDHHEQEADRVARQVVNHIHAAQTTQRQPKEETIEADTIPSQQMLVQTKAQDAVSGQPVTDEVETTIQQARGDGSPLVQNLRTPMEDAFGADFSSVRIHTDARSHQLNQSIQAKAFTTGQDIFFRQGMYSPHSQSGQELIAHELTHVVQQNAGVQRQGHGPIQRSVGFEAELSVPTMPAPPNALNVLAGQLGPTGNAPTPQIEGFLKGGLEYGDSADLGPAGAHFQLKADHNELQDLHKAIVDKLWDMNYFPPARARSMSNLEYVTPAEDEMAAHSNATILGHVDAIAAHAANLFPAVTNQMQAIPAPSATAYTGIPEQDFRNWLDTDYPQIANEIDAYKNAIQDRFYLQATAGIIPSAIRDLHRRHTPQNQADVNNISELALYRVNDIITQLENLGQFRNHAFVRAMREGKEEKGWVWGTTQKPARPIDYESFMGVLHLAYMYMVGSALNQTSLLDGTSKKNAVPFLSKMSNMRSIITRAAPSLQANRPPANLITFIDNLFKRTQYVSVDFWLAVPELEDRRGTEGREPIVQDSFMSDLLAGNWLWPESWIGGSTQVAAVSTGEERTFNNPDTLPAEVSQASAGQQGAQFEYRIISARPDSAGLRAALKTVLDEVRDLNLKHMAPNRKDEIIDAAEN